MATRLRQHVPWWAVLLLAVAAAAGCATRGASAAFIGASVRPGDHPRQLAFAWEFRGTADRFRLEADPDGASGFAAVDVNADGHADAADEIPGRRGGVDLAIPLSATDFANARFRVVALDADGTELERSGALAIHDITVERLIGYFKAASPGIGGRFGAQVALSADGATLAVGAPGEAGGGERPLPHAGAVHLFRRGPDGDWSRHARLRGANTGAGDLFGAGLALSADGRTLAVGAPGEGGAATGVDGPDNDQARPWAGAVYVFGRDARGGWSQQAYVKASNTGARDAFGSRLALSTAGDTLAVGAWGEDGGATGIDGAQHDLPGSAGLFPRGAGAVYVFGRDGAGRWTQQAYVKASNTGADDWFGDSVALSGDGRTLAVGASKEDGAAAGIGGRDDDAAPDAGAVYLYTRDAAGRWAQQAYLKASRPLPGAGFGGSVALSAAGDTLAVGAWREDAATAVGGVGHGTADAAGAVHLFSREAGGAWRQQTELRAANADAGDVFGARVALSADGDTLAVGAWGEDGDATGIDGPDNDNAADRGRFPASAGAVYLFRRDTAGAWSQRAYIKASNTGAGDVFGDSVALSADGDVLAVGASNEDGDAAGIDGPGSASAGAAYLY